MMDWGMIFFLVVLVIFKRVKRKGKMVVKMVLVLDKKF